MKMGFRRSESEIFWMLNTSLGDAELFAPLKKGLIVPMAKKSGSTLFECHCTLLLWWFELVLFAGFQKSNQERDQVGALDHNCYISIIIIARLL